MPQKNTLSVLAIIFAGVSVLFLPILFGPAALVLGIVAAVKKEKLGVLALVLSVVLPIIGFVLGFVLAAAALSAAYGY
jgi:hypothetical protein